MKTWKALSVSWIYCAYGAFVLLYLCLMLHELYGYVFSFLLVVSLNFWPFISIFATIILWPVFFFLAKSRFLSYLRLGQRFFLFYHTIGRSPAYYSRYIYSPKKIYDLFVGVASRSLSARSLANAALCVCVLIAGCGARSRPATRTRRHRRHVPSIPQRSSATTSTCSAGATAICRWRTSGNTIWVSRQICLRASISHECN